MRSAMLLLIDGLGDVSIRELGDRTPLQVAQTPFLDALAGIRDDGWTTLSFWNGRFSQWYQWFDGSSRARHGMWQRHGPFVSPGIRPSDVRAMIPRLCAAAYSTRRPLLGTIAAEEPLKV